MGCDIRVFHTKQNLLVVILRQFSVEMGLLTNGDLLGSMFRHEGTDDTGKENHHHHTIQHIIAHEILTRSHLQTHAYHHHRDGTSSMS